MNPIRPDQQTSVIELQHRTREREREMANIRLVAEAANNQDPNEEVTPTPAIAQRAVALLAALLSMR